MLSYDVRVVRQVYLNLSSWLLILYAKLWKSINCGSNYCIFFSANGHVASSSALFFLNGRTPRHISIVRMDLASLPVLLYQTDSAS
jgi:hypothetical protein